MLSESERKLGVWTISAGNAGQGVAYAAKRAGIPSTVVVIETAPASKIERMRALGAKLIPVPYEAAWQALEERSYPGAEGTFVHPFDDHNFIAGHATMGLEILEDARSVAVIAATAERTDHGRVERDQSVAARLQSGRGTENRRAGGVVFAAGSRKCSRIGSPPSWTAPAPKRLPANVGKDEPWSMATCRQPRGNQGTML